MEEGTAFAVDEQRAAILVNGQQQPAVGTDTDGAYLLAVFERKRGAGGLDEVDLQEVRVTIAVTAAEPQAQ